MIPRQDMVSIDITQPMDQVLHEILNTRHSRIPVYEVEADNIIGILSMKDFSIEMSRTDLKDIDIRTILQKPYFRQFSRHLREDGFFRYV